MLKNDGHDLSVSSIAPDGRLGRGVTTGPTLRAEMGEQEKTGLALIAKGLKTLSSVNGNVKYSLDMIYPTRVGRVCSSLSKLIARSSLHRCGTGKARDENRTRRLRN